MKTDQEKAAIAVKAQQSADANRVENPREVADHSPLYQREERPMANAVFCMAQTEAQAIRIVDQLQAAGFPPHDISVLFPDKNEMKDFAYEQHTKASEGTGTSMDGVLSSARGWLVGIGAIAILGLGPLVVVGPIMAALSGAAAGAARLLGRPDWLGVPSI